MLNKEESQRLSILSFPLIVGVVIAHAYKADVGFSTGSIGLVETSAVTSFIRDCIARVVARSTVPVFFMISGYLFFINFDGTRASFLSKMTSRAKTLLVPFLIWNIANLAVMAMLQSMPSMQQFFSGNNARIASFGGFDYLNAIFGLDRTPIAYQFWFIRDLMVLVILSPVIYLLTRQFAVATLVVLSLGWFGLLWPFYIPSPEGIFFFFIGSLLACRKKSIFPFDDHAPWIVAAYLVAVVLDVFLLGSRAGLYVHNFTVFLGAFALMSLSRSVLRWPRLKNSLIGLGAAGFFVFAAHEPLLTIFRKIVYKAIVPDSDLCILVLFFLIPSLVLVLLVQTYKIISIKFSKFTSLITGGR